MGMTRKQLLNGTAATLGAAGLAGCTPLVNRFATPELPAALPDAGGDPYLRRALNRIAFGPRPEDLIRVGEIGLNAYVEEQLAPERVEEGVACTTRLGMLDTLDMEADDARDWDTANYAEPGDGPAARELQQAALIRAVYSGRQLQENMVEFWTNHFNISQLKGECSWLKTVDDRLIRRHALGRFRDLLGASAHSAAMLFYLDNAGNRKRDPEVGAEPNENYARELLELHTLGVDGGYTLKDIQEVARCFTGWTYKTGFQWRPGEFHFEGGQHDDGPKYVLGTRLPAGQGVRDGVQILDLAARHPSTARFLARKLVRRFLSDQPLPELEARVAATFQKTNGDIRQTMSVLLHSEEFHRGVGQKLKRPLEYVASALRITGAVTDGVGPLAALQAMGQLPFHWPMPDGYPDRAAPWFSGLLARWNFALDLVLGRIEGTQVPMEALLARVAGDTPELAFRRLAELVVGAPLPRAAEHRLLTQGGPGDRSAWLAALLASPAFQAR